MKRRKLKMMEWNMNFAGYNTVKPAFFVSKYIKGFDVVILTEVRNNGYLKKIVEQIQGYDFICSDDQGEYSNQVVIIAKAELELAKVSGKLGVGIMQPDFLHGRITVENKIVNIVGARIKIGKASSYKDRFEQFKKLKEYVDSLESVICAGDFNSGQIRGNEEDDYSKFKELYQYRNNTRELSELRFYNFHLMKKELGEKYVLREVMSEDNSWGLVERNGVLCYGLGFRVKNDLLFYSKDISGNGEYSWAHVREHENEYLDMIIRNRYKRGNKISHGYPDHARLIAELCVV